MHILCPLTAKTFFVHFISSGNWKNLRRLQMQAHPPMLPYFGMFAQDVIAIEETTNKRASDGTINWDALWRVNAMIDKHLIYQNTGYHSLTLDPAATAFMVREMEMASRLDDDWIYQTAESVKKRDRSKYGKRERLSKDSSRRSKSHSPWSSRSSDTELTFSMSSLMGGGHSTANKRRKHKKRRSLLQRMGSIGSILSGHRSSKSDASSIAMAMDKLDGLDPLASLADDEWDDADHSEMDTVTKRWDAVHGVDGIAGDSADEMKEDRTADSVEITGHEITEILQIIR